MTDRDVIITKDLFLPLSRGGVYSLLCIAETMVGGMGMDEVRSPTRWFTAGLIAATLFRQHATAFLIVDGLTFGESGVVYCR